MTSRSAGAGPAPAGKSVARLAAIMNETIAVAASTYGQCLTDRSLIAPGGFIDAAWGRENGFPASLPAGTTVAEAPLAAKQESWAFSSVPREPRGAIIRDWAVDGDSSGLGGMDKRSTTRK